MKLIENLFGFDRAETTGQRVFFRAFELFVALATVYLAWSWGRYTLRLSDVVLPLGLARYLDISFMFGNSLPLWNAAAISVLVTLGFFRTPRLERVAYALAFVLLLFQYAARYSLGEIPHSANMLGMALLGVALGFGAFGINTAARRFALGITYFYIGLGYSLAAWSKLIATGPLWVDGRHLWLWIYEKAIDSMAKTGSFDLNWVQELLLQSRLLATAFLAFGLLCEFLAFLVWWRRFRLPVMMGILALHIGIYYTMNILFRLSMVELVLLALPWAAWIDAALESRYGSRLLARTSRIFPSRVSPG